MQAAGKVKRVFQSSQSSELTNTQKIRILKNIATKPSVADCKIKPDDPENEPYEPDKTLGSLTY